ncbi:MAG: DUF1836 domain-containing protein [Clostridia bacterium]|jgi:hypothetical protein|nr:DUF1836 domain-containing protein [Clostridia bacterium]
MKNDSTTFLDNFHIPRWEELPSIDLYLDQVVNLINSCLSPYLFFSNNCSIGENELLTKTMINNYVKNSLIEPPIKKQYSRSQLSKLFVICVLKQVYSMQDIKILIDVALKNSNIKTAYNKFCNLFEEALICTYTKKDFIDTHSTSDNLYLLKSVLLSCSYKIYVHNITNIKSEKS